MLPAPVSLLLGLNATWNIFSPGYTREIVRELHHGGLIKRS
jgi:hypothetical protein